MPIIKHISTGYSPREWQKKIHFAHQRFKFLIIHRRAGKTVAMINEIIDKALKCPLKNPQYAYLAPTYSQAKKIAWQYIRDFAGVIPGATFNEQELLLTIPRGNTIVDGVKKNDVIKVFLLGAENYNSLRGIYLDGAVLDEFADMHPDLWSTVIRPALSDRLGWATIVGTARPGAIHQFYKNIKDNPAWFTLIMKASESGLIAQAELDAAKIEMGEEAYLQEYECEFETDQEANYYLKYVIDMEKNGKMREGLYDLALPVQCFFDLGVGDSTAIWFRQVLKNEHRAVDYYEASGKGIEHYAQVLQKKNYYYNRIILPHDAKARQLSTGKTIQESMEAFFRGIVEIQKKQNKQDRINASRVLLSSIYMDNVKCARGIECLKSYKREWDAKNQIYSDDPKHDWSSHGSDAFGYMALDNRGGQSFSERVKDLPRDAIIN